MKTALVAMAASFGITSLMAETLTFDFADAKGVNNVVFMLDAPLEAINGTAAGISGTITVDMEDVASAKGKIVIDAKSLTVPNPVMQEHLHGEKWLHTGENGEITFEVEGLKNVVRDGDTATADAVGVFTLMGVAKEMEIPVRLTYLPGRLKERGGDVDGDLVVIRSSFTINRSEFGIQPGENTDKVAEEIELTLSIAGASPKG
jgi:polyisoprenoid-binding protein YceI